MAPLGGNPGSSGAMESSATTSSIHGRFRSRADANRSRQASSTSEKALAKKPGELSENEIPPGMGQAGINMLRQKKIIENQLAVKLKDNIEKQDTLAGLLNRSLKKDTSRDKVVATAKGVDETIKSTVFKDPEHRSRMYRVEVQMGKFTSDLVYRKEGRKVTIEGATCNGHKLLKEVKVEFPNTVDMAKLVVVCKGSKVEMRVPIRHWESMPCLFQAANAQSSSDQSDVDNSTRESRSSSNARRRNSSYRRTRSRSQSRRKDSGNDTEDSQAENGFPDRTSPDDSGFLSSDTESLPDTSGLTELSLVDEWFKRNRLWNRFTWNI